MPYVGNSPAANFASVTKDTFSGNASTTAFTLSKAATTNGVAVFVENVRQVPTTAYAVSGTTLTFTAAPPTGTNNIYVLHHNTPASTATHPAAQDLTAVNGTMTGTLSVTGASTLTGATTVGGTSNLTITDGDLVVGTSGHGIDFSATANSSVTGTGNQAELLADYEKGTWTPADNNGNVTFAQKQGSYVKIGDQVTAWGFINTASSVTDTNAVQLKGLPFTTAAAGDAASGTAARGHGTISFQDFTTNMVHLHTVRDSQLVQMFDGSGAITYNELTGSKTVMFGVTYHTGIA
jgi:hypothetical protein